MSPAHLNGFEHKLNMLVWCGGECGTSGLVVLLQEAVGVLGVRSLNDMREKNSTQGKKAHKDF